jgi:hypothetical protein
MSPQRSRFHGSHEDTKMSRDGCNDAHHLRVFV